MTRLYGCYRNNPTCRLVSLIASQSVPTDSVLPSYIPTRESSAVKDKAGKSSPLLAVSSCWFMYLIWNAREVASRPAPFASIVHGGREISSTGQPVSSRCSRHEVEHCMGSMQDPRHPCTQRETLRTHDWFFDNLKLLAERGDRSDHLRALFQAISVYDLVLSTRGTRSDCTRFRW